MVNVYILFLRFPLTYIIMISYFFKFKILILESHSGKKIFGVEDFDCPKEKTWKSLILLNTVFLMRGWNLHHGKTKQNKNLLWFFFFFESRKLTLPQNKIWQGNWGLGIWECAGTYVVIESGISYSYNGGDLGIVNEQFFTDKFT